MNNLKKFGLATTFVLMAGVNSQIDASAGKVFRILGNSITAASGAYVLYQYVPKAIDELETLALFSSDRKPMNKYLKKNFKNDVVEKLLPSGAVITAGVVTVYTGLKGFIKVLTPAPQPIAQEDEDNSKY